MNGLKTLYDGLQGSWKMLETECKRSKHDLELHQLEVDKRSKHDLDLHQLEVDSIDSGENSQLKTKRKILTDKIQLQISQIDAVYEKSFFVN